MSVFLLKHFLKLSHANYQLTKIPLTSKNFQTCHRKSSWT